MNVKAVFCSKFERQPNFYKEGVNLSFGLHHCWAWESWREIYFYTPQCRVLAIDYLAQAFNTKVDKIKFKGLTGSFEYADKKVLLLKPMTYMNSSGDSIVEAVNFYKVKPES